MFHFYTYCSNLSRNVKIIIRLCPYMYYYVARFQTLFPQRPRLATSKKFHKSYVSPGVRRRIWGMVNAQAVRAARLRAGFRTQQQLAEAVGCARQTINRAEKGSGGATILQRIALVLGVPPETLMEPAASMSNTAPTPEELTVLSALRKLDPGRGHSLCSPGCRTGGCAYARPPVWHPGRGRALTRTPGRGASKRWHKQPSA